MLIKTLLNKTEKHKGFVYVDVRLVEGGKDRLIVDIRPHKRSKPMCSGCDRRGPCYDTLKDTRYFQFVPLWGILVMFAYRMRRVNCPRCGVKVEKVPWADGKSPVTTSYAWFLSQWAKLMNWKQVASAFGTTWDTAYRAVGLAVAWGLEHRDLKGIRSIGVDEVHWHRGQKYLTVVYQIDEHCKRLLWIGKERTTETLNAFFDEFGLRARWLEYVCSDMWKPYLQVLAKRAKRATHVLDRYHIVAKMNKAIDEVRAEEAKRMKADGFDPLLAASRLCVGGVLGPEPVQGAVELLLALDAAPRVDAVELAGHLLHGVGAGSAVGGQTLGALKLAYGAAEFPPVLAVVFVVWQGVAGRGRRLAAPLDQRALKQLDGARGRVPAQLAFGLAGPVDELEIGDDGVAGPLRVRDGVDDSRLARLGRDVICLMPVESRSHAVAAHCGARPRWRARSAGRASGTSMLSISGLGCTNMRVQDLRPGITRAGITRAGITRAGISARRAGISARRAD